MLIDNFFPQFMFSIWRNSLQLYQIFLFGVVYPYNTYNCSSISCLYHVSGLADELNALAKIAYN